METISLQEKRKEYYVKNRDYIKAKSAEYYSKNKQRVLKRMAEKHKLDPSPARKRAKDFATRNPDKVKGYQKSWKERHPEKRKLYTRHSRIRKYGIEPEEYYRLLEKQGHGCAICRAESNDRAMNIDHDHKSGKVRGLLCNGCNMGLGFLEKDGFLKKALQYLAKYK